MSLAQPTKDAPTPSPWSFRLLTAFGIPIRIHFTFVIFLTWIAFISDGGGLLWVSLVLAVFACVLLHELGHALTARRFGIETRDITLYPIGGLAMLADRPKAVQEFWISLAGPAVNVVLAIILGVYLALVEHHVPPVSFSINGATFAGALYLANISLAIFNLIPAFPMDGGRVLRALLAIRMPEARATQIAGGIGQALAIALGFYGILTPNPILMLIAFFVFLGAGQEVGASVTRSFLDGHVVRDALQSRFRTIPSGASLEAAAAMLLEGSQHDFPVMNGPDGDVLGILTRNDITRGLSTEGPSGYVAGHMRRMFKTVRPEDSLEAAAEMFSREDMTPILVIEDDQLIGMLTQENLSEFIMLEHARRQGSRPSRR